jgi:phosphoglycerol transferase MdoB-like AlkP superfamily enzyme
MKKIINYIPNYIKAILGRMGIVLIFMTLSRIVFYIANQDSFVNVGIVDFLTGIWFDCITIGIYFIPIYGLFLLPLPIRGYKWNKLFFKLLFHITNAVILFLNIIDVEYFQFTSKRSTADLFAIVSAGNDMSQLVMSFIKDFWLLILIFILFIIVSEWMYRKTEVAFEKISDGSKAFYLKNSASFLLFVPFFFIIGRGGLGIRPVGIIEASNYSSVENTALILNTPFTMIKTLGKESLEMKNYFTEAEENKLFSPIQQSTPQHILPDGTNVMLIILESFGDEFVGAYNQAESYTPFFDSLIGQSLHFEYGFANGKKSIEAVPAIVASIPSLMDNPYISSPYGNNKINSLAKILGDKGYSSAFFHGATNGSMRFDGFAAQAGYQNYFGRFEYKNDKHFDKTWGILDEYFNPWTARQMSKLKEPFFSTLFTLSSHHPYYIPEKWKNKVKKGSQPICASINYSDISLKLFFEEAKKQTWYNNTLFVICADHTPATNNLFYSQRSQMYKIPIVFYHPTKLKAKREAKIFQQVDILPTVLDLVNVNSKFYSFGKSYYQKSDREAFTFIEGSYFYFFKNHMLSFSNDKARNLYDFVVRDGSTVDSLSNYKKECGVVEKRLKAIIQRYNRDLILNQTTVE